MQTFPNPVTFYEAIGKDAPGINRRPELLRMGGLRITEKPLHNLDGSIELYTREIAQIELERNGMRLPTFFDIASKIMVPGFDGDLPRGKRTRLFLDMAHGHPEWKDDCAYSDDINLYWFTGIDGLLWDAQARRYNVSKMTVSTVEKYESRGLEFGKVNQIDDIARHHPEFILQRFGTTYDNLPDVLLNASEGFYLPESRVLQPIGGTLGSRNLSKMAVRGVIRT